MPRNKYPEKTVERILQTSYYLFTTRGYDNVSIQNIVDELGDITKGAIYHHFKSKDEILSAIFDKLCEEYSFTNMIKNHTGLNALEKIRASFKEAANDENVRRMNMETIPLIHNPHFFTQLVETVLKNISPQIEELIKEGNEDGSMRVESKYTKDNSMEGAFRKIDMLKVILDAIGIPLLDEEMTEVSKQYVRRFYIDE